MWDHEFPVDRIEVCIGRISREEMEAILMMVSRKLTARALADLDDAHWEKVPPAPFRHRIPRSIRLSGARYGQRCGLGPIRRKRQEKHR